MYTDGYVIPVPSPLFICEVNSFREGFLKLPKADVGQLVKKVAVLKRNGV